jgi:hypothetical protein
LNNWRTFARHVRQEEVQSAVSCVIEHFDRLDIVVANIGVVPASDVDLADWDETFAGQRPRHDGHHQTFGTRIEGARDSTIVAQFVARESATIGLYGEQTRGAGNRARGRAGRRGFNVRVDATGPRPVVTEALLERMNCRAGRGCPTVAAALAGHARQRLMRTAAAALFRAGGLSSGSTHLLVPIDAGIS